MLKLLVAALLLAGCADEPAAPAVERTSDERVDLAPAAPSGPAELAVERSWRRVVVDAGHGGEDHGAEGVSGALEKDVTLSIARLLAVELVRSGFEVVLTRDEDAALPLPHRSGRGNASGAGLFLSIHANSAVTPRARGIETYWMDLASDEAALRVAERENRAETLARDAGAGGGDPLDAVVTELRQGAVALLSRDLARSVHRSLVGGLRDYYGEERIGDRGVKTAPFWVLVDSQVPSALVEVGYLTNPDEEVLLRTRAWQAQVAVGIAAGVRDFVTAMEAEGDAP